MNNNDAVNQICTYIKNKIISRALFPGSWIVEETLAKETGFSRTSIRAALQKLKYDGFIDIQKNRGAFVVQPTIESIMQAYTVRRGLEIMAIELAIPQFEEFAIQRMSDNLDAQNELKNKFSIGEYASLNRDFHWAIVEQAHNSYLEKYLNELYNQTHVYMLFYDSSADNTGSLTTHAAILKAIKKRDVAEGIKAVIQDSNLAIHDTRAS